MISKGANDPVTLNYFDRSSYGDQRRFVGVPVDGAGQAGPSHSHGAVVSETTVGENQAHNNMPPYITVYMWKRTA